MEFLIGKLLPNQKFEIDYEETQANESGNIIVDTDNLPGKQKINPIKTYDDKLDNILSPEGRCKLFIHMGNSSSIMIYDTAAVIDKDMKTTRDVLMWGVECGVLCRGTNSVWKVMNRAYKEFMLDYVKEVHKQTFKPVTQEERIAERRKILAELKDEFEPTEGGEEGSIEEVDGSSSGRIVKKIGQAPSVREKTLQELQKELTVWTERTHDIEHGNEAVDKVNALKNEIRQLQMKNSPLLQKKNVVLPSKKPALHLSPVPGKKPQK